MKSLSIEEIIKKVKEIPSKKWKDEGSLKQGHQYSTNVGFGKKVIISYAYNFNPHYNEDFHLEVNYFGKRILETRNKEIISLIYSNIIRAN